MSDDLISRKILSDELASLRISLTNISCIQKAVDETIKSVLRIVNEQPVAFDKEKVIEKLTERFIACCDTPRIKSECTDVEQVYQEGRSQGRYEVYLGAIKIVKKGEEI